MTASANGTAATGIGTNADLFNPSGACFAHTNAAPDFRFASYSAGASEWQCGWSSEHVAGSRSHDVLPALRAQ